MITTQYIHFIDVDLSSTNGIEALSNNLIFVPNLHTLDLCIFLYSILHFQLGDDNISEIGIQYLIESLKYVPNLRKKIINLN